MIKTYKDMEVTLIRSTDNPNALIKLASDITQKAELSEEKASEQLIKYLITANHTSLFEHMTTTWLIRDVSRSFLAQITRHRMASYTAGSQHYQEYDEYPCVVSDELSKIPAAELIFNGLDDDYRELLKVGIKPEEARQILPNAKGVNILWTVNVRSLINFLNLRLCERNVAEMKMFAIDILFHCTRWWPEVFKHIGPDCFMLGKCRQGRMRAEKCRKSASPWTKPI